MLRYFASWHRPWSYQNEMYVCMAVCAMLMFSLAVILTNAGAWVVLWPFMLVLSPGAMAFLRHYYEGGLKKSFFDPDLMSNAFVIGDTFFLTFAMMFAGLGRQGVTVSLGYDVALQVFGLASGLLAVAAFRKVDGQRYINVGWASALKSPTKVWHDWVVFTVTIALFIWLLIPQITTHGYAFWLSLMWIGCFVVTVTMDGIKGPDVTRQHYRWDEIGFQPAAPL